MNVTRYHLIAICTCIGALVVVDHSIHCQESGCYILYIKVNYDSRDANIKHTGGNAHTHLHDI